MDTVDFMMFVITALFYAGATLTLKVIGYKDLYIMLIIGVWAVCVYLFNY